MNCALTGDRNFSISVVNCEHRHIKTIVLLPETTYVIAEIVYNPVRICE